MNTRHLLSLPLNTVKAWLDDEAPSMGAALAYYSFFSMAPLLLIVVAVAGLVFGEDAARREIVLQLVGLVGTDGARAVDGVLASAAKPVEGALATLIGVALLLVGATTVFAELQSSLDRIWRVRKQRDESGWLSLVRARLLGFGLVVALGFLLVVSLVFNAALAGATRWLEPAFGGWATLAAGLSQAAGVLLVSLLFALIYKLLPRTPIRWSDVWVGAVVTALLFSAGKWLIGVYLAQVAVASAFGAAGSLVVVLVWVYYSAQVFLLGAEFTRLYSQRAGVASIEVAHAA